MENGYVGYFHILGTHRYIFYATNNTMEIQKIINQIKKCIINKKNKIDDVCHGEIYSCIDYKYVYYEIKNFLDTCPTMICATYQCHRLKSRQFKCIKNFMDEYFRMYNCGLSMMNFYESENYNET